MAKFNFGNLGFNHINFSKKHEADETYSDRLVSECRGKECIIKREIEKMLSYICDNTANLARTTYPGVDMF
jgi:hypothetical protein